MRFHLLPPRGDPTHRAPSAAALLPTALPTAHPTAPQSAATRSGPRSAARSATCLTTLLAAAVLAAGLLGLALVGCGQPAIGPTAGGAVTSDTAEASSTTTEPAASSTLPPETLPPLPADTELTVGEPTGATFSRLLGVNLGPLSSHGERSPVDATAAYREMGVELVRTHDFYGPLDMATMFPDLGRDPDDPASYRFDRSDFAWRTIVDGGFEPYLRLGDSWNNVRAPGNPRERATWARAAVQVVGHYYQGRWNGFHTPLRYVEIWNEPDFGRFWPEPRNLVDFFDLYVQTACALKKAFPELAIGGAGFTQSSVFLRQGRRMIHDFLAYIKKNAAPLDFLSWHLYDNDPQHWTEAATFYRQELEASGFPQTALHVTEWNTDTHLFKDDSPEATALRAGPKGAAILTAAWIAMQKSGVAEAAFYSGIDPVPGLPAGYGLLYGDGSPKPVGRAFSLWKALADHPRELEVTASAETPLWILAGRDERGETAVLLANPSEKAVRYTVTLAERAGSSAGERTTPSPARPATPSSAGTGRLELLTVESEQPPAASTFAWGDVVEIGPFAVQLVRILR